MHRSVGGDKRKFISALWTEGGAFSDSVSAFSAKHKITFKKY
jgi:hypothetical protein